MPRIKTTRWRPDTHPDTEIEYEWDADLPPDQRVHTVVRARVRGVEREDVAQAGLAVLTANKRKNVAVQAVMDEAKAYGVSAESIVGELSEQDELTVRVRGVALGQDQKRRIINGVKAGLVDAVSIIFD